MKLVTFLTWSRQVNNQIRESIIHNVHSSNPTAITNVHGVKPLFGGTTPWSICRLNLTEMSQVPTKEETKKLIKRMIFIFCCQIRTRALVMTLSKDIGTR
jgi:hypothetical protein